MIVRIGDYVLARGSAYRESPIGLSIASARAVQQSRPIRATSVHNWDRKLIATTISFGVSRLHATLEDAQEFSLTHASVLLNVSGIILMLTETGTARTISTSGLVQQVQFGAGGLHRGISTFAQYTLLCGELESEPGQPLQNEDGTLLLAENGEVLIS